MAFNVAYQPNFGLVGGLAFQAGAKSREDELGLRLTQMALQDMMQRRQITASQQSQVFDQFNRERMATFGAELDQQRQARQAALDAQARQQQANQQRSQMQFQSQLQSQRENAVLEKERLHQQLMFDRQMQLQRQEAQDRMALQDISLRHSSGANSLAAAQKSLNDFIGGMQELELSDTGNAKRQQFLKELEVIDNDDTLSDSHRADAYQKWLRRASSLQGPQYQKPKERDLVGELTKNEIAPGTYVVEDKDGKPTLVKGYDRRTGTVDFDPVDGRAFVWGNDGGREYLEPTAQEEFEAISKVAKELKGSNTTMTWDEAYTSASAQYKRIRSERERQSPSYGSPVMLWKVSDPDSRRRLFERNPVRYLASTNARIDYMGMPEERVRQMAHEIQLDLDTINRLYPQGSGEGMIPDAILAYARQRAALLSQLVDQGWFSDSYNTFGNVKITTPGRHGE